MRSNGTVGYVGKDIAYHLWKFGLLGRDFGYRRFYRYPNEHEVWISAEQGEPDHPHFGGVAPSTTSSMRARPIRRTRVIEALRLLGYTEQAEHYTHFSYEMVALTPRCAMELGYPRRARKTGASAISRSAAAEGSASRPTICIDRLIAAATKRSTPPCRTRDEGARRHRRQIAIGALRYFMLKFTKQSVIAFDFKEALAFEGETGPYAQYAVVRARNIFRKGGTSIRRGARRRRRSADFAPYFAGEAGTEIWQLWLLAGQDFASSSSNALPPPSRRTSPSMPSSWRSSSTTSITGTTS